MEDASDVCIVGIATASILSTEPVICRSCRGRDNDIVALSNGDEKPGGVVGNKRNKIGCDYCHCVRVKRNPPPAIDRCINKSKTVFQPTNSIVSNCVFSQLSLKIEFKFGKFK